MKSPGRAGGLLLSTGQLTGRNAAVILVDENISLAEELFAPLGEMQLVKGREVDENYPGIERVKVLAIRSVTMVTPALVDRAQNLEVIGTATIGTDHIHLGYIAGANLVRQRRISVVSAPGSNADSVADYIWLALLHITREERQPLGRKSIGIVGFGNCGSRVARRAEGFGMKVLKYDPPLDQSDAGFVSDPLDDVLRADFVTLHVPLTMPGQSPYPTYHMIGRDEIGRMAESAYLFNAARGAVVNSPDLVEALKDGRIRGAVLDVFEGEPAADPELITLPLIATPHIAGYAEEGKRRGSIVIYEGIVKALGLEAPDAWHLLLKGFSPGVGTEVSFEPSGSVDLSADIAVRTLLARIHDITAASDALRATLSSPERGALFDKLRKEYAEGARHELSAYRVKLADGMSPPLAEAIAARLRPFGTRITDAEPHYVLLDVLLGHHT